MINVIIGLIIGLLGVGLMASKNTILGLLGMLIFVVGLYVGLKGRKKLDRNKL